MTPEQRALITAHREAWIAALGEAMREAGYLVWVCQDYPADADVDAAYIAASTRMWLELRALRRSAKAALQEFRLGPAWAKVYQS